MSGNMRSENKRTCRFLSQEQSKVVDSVAGKSPGGPGETLISRNEAHLHINKVGNSVVVESLKRKGM